MSRKHLLLTGFIVLLLVNGSIFGTLYILAWLQGPTPEELAALREAEQQAALDAIYAQLPPLEPFKSKINYLRSIGEAIALCEDKLHESVSGRKSWEINMIESRYIQELELYKIFLNYQTPATIDMPMKGYEVACEVSGEKRTVESWKADLIE